MDEKWKDHPYNPISSFYQDRFGEKVYKIPVSVFDSCPNREGLKGMETCVFCDVWGSAARAEAKTLPLIHQIKKYKKHIGERFGARKFLVYFQAYTNSFAKLQTIRSHFFEALEQDNIVGIVVGTRPDCISPALFRLWQEVHEQSFVSVELGAQTFNEDLLIYLKRGHTHQQTLRAIERIQNETSVDLGLHFMFGLPGETDSEIIEMARETSRLKIDNVKLHNLHVLKDTPLEQEFFSGKFTPCTLEEYSNKVSKFLSHLDPKIYVHRLAAFASRWDELIAPDWTRNKMGTHQSIIGHMRENKTFQGKALLPNTHPHLGAPISRQTTGETPSLV